MQSFHLRRARTVVLSALACFTLASAYAGSPDRDLPNLQKVDDHVYRGAQPTDEGLKKLSQLGIKTVVDLRQIGEHSQEHEKDVVSALGMRYVSLPMKGLSAPKDDQVAAALRLMTDTSNGPVFVHCKRGADRTGLVAAVYRIAHDGWENAKALHEAKSYGMSFWEQAIQHYVMVYKPPVVLATSETVSAAAATAGAAQ